MDDEVADALEDLLEAERAALLRGDIEAVTRLAPRKERLAARLAEAETPAGRAEELGRAARHNARLLEAAAAGLKAATTRLRALAEPMQPLSVYDGRGHRQDLVRPESTVTRRA